VNQTANASTVSRNERDPTIWTITNKAGDQRRNEPEEHLGESEFGLLARRDGCDPCADDRQGQRLTVGKGRQARYRHCQGQQSRRAQLPQVLPSSTLLVSRVTSY